ncbi:hypothetical protein NBRC116589_44580 [Ruegeria sp. HU-ET01832]|uniref:hypothetical protein n=1 Tax=Ruegeria sp. HU-ET01832 TaxID=3135906 RepID=UPI00310452F4
MGLKKLAEKMVEYNSRLEAGKAEKIKSSHVQKVLKKLRKKAADIEAEIHIEKNSDRKARLVRKLGTAHESVKRAEWLLREID